MADGQPSIGQPLGAAGAAAVDAFAPLQFDRRTVAELRRATSLLVGMPSRLNAAADEIRQLLAAHDPATVLSFWGYHGVIALAVERASGLGVEQPLWAGTAEAQREYAAETAAIQELVTVQAVRRLHRAGIPSVSFKGPLMARDLYPDFTLRTASNDIDLIVDPDHLRAGAKVLDEMGWLPAEDPDTTGGFPDLHLSHPGPGESPRIELHWRVQQYEGASHTRMLMADAVTDGPVPVWGPVRTLEVLLLCFARDGLHRLKLPADIAAWWDVHGAAYGDEARATLTAGSLARPITVAAAAVAAIVGTPPLDDHAGRRDRWEAAAVRVARFDRPVPHREMFSQMLLVDALVAPPGRRVSTWSRTWIRNREHLTWRHPRLARPGLITPLRLISLARTSARAIHLLTRRR